LISNEFFSQNTPKSLSAGALPQTPLRTWETYSSPLQNSVTGFKGSFAGRRNGEEDYGGSCRRRRETRRGRKGGRDEEGRGIAPWLLEIWDTRI